MPPSGISTGNGAVTATEPTTCTPMQDPHLLNWSKAMRCLMRWLLTTLLSCSPALGLALDVTPDTPMAFSDPKETMVLDVADVPDSVQAALKRLANFRPAADAGRPRSGQRYWVLATLHSRLERDREFRVDVPLWESVEAYAIDSNGHVTPLRTSGLFQGAHNKLAFQNPFTTSLSQAASQFTVFTLPAGQETRLLLSLQSNPNTLPATLTPLFSDHARQLEQRRLGLVIEGLMVGIQLALCIFGWYSVLQNRDRTSIYYATWIMFAMLSTTTLYVHDGSRMFEFMLDIEGVRSGLHTLSWNLASAVSYAQAITYALFARNFLDLKTHVPRVHQLTNVYVGMTLIHLGIVVFVPHQLPTSLLWGPLAILLLITLPSIWACAYYRYRQGYRIALFFMLAMIPYLFFRMLFILGSLLQVKSPFMLLESKGLALFMQNTSTAQAVGVCCEALIMGLAVFTKNRWLQDELKQEVESQNQRLEATVAERTRELADSKADTERQHQLVLDSISYASRLQKAQLPRTQRLDGRFRSFDAIWEPRDTIGGDVWWVSPPDEQGCITLALADCTGHGVPGAMLSVLASTSLERIVAANPGLDPSAMLMALDQALRRGLNQDVEGAESDDGCDAAIVRIDTAQRVLEFAGAKLGLMHAHADGHVDRIQPARISLGYPSPPKDVPPVHTIRYASGDSFLLVTDGITDQVGGEGSPRAYGYRRLTELLQACKGLDAVSIAHRIRDELNAWQGSQLRRDDMTALVLAMD